MIFGSYKRNSCSWETKGLLFFGRPKLELRSVALGEVYQQTSGSSYSQQIINNKLLIIINFVIQLALCVITLPYQENLPCLIFVSFFSGKAVICVQACDSMELVPNLQCCLTGAYFQRHLIRHILLTTEELRLSRNTTSTF